MSLDLFGEEYPMSTLDMSIHSETCSQSHCTLFQVESLYNLRNVNINKLDIVQITDEEHL